MASFLSRLFSRKPGGGPVPAAEAGEDYKGFTIIPTAKPEGGQYRIAARIEKVVAGQPLRHALIRADVVTMRDEANAISLAKARQLIDEQGDQLFAPR